LIKLEVVNDGYLWGELIGSSPYTTIFHEWRWLKVAEKHSGCELYCIAGYKGMEPVAVIPVFLKKAYGIKFAFSPPPSLAIPYLGLLILDYDVLKSSTVEFNYRQFLKVLDGFLRNELKADYIRIFSPPDLVDARPFKWAGYTVDPFYSYLIRLNRSLDELWMSLEKKLRQNIKKTRKLNFEMSEGGQKELEKVVELVNLRYRDQNRRAKVNPEYLKEVYRQFEENISVFVVEYEGEVVTGIVDLSYRNTVSSWIGNPKTTVSGYYPNDLLNWYALERAHRNGFVKYEIIGANTERLAEFKSKYNPDLRLYFLASKLGRKARVADYVYRIAGGNLL